jgi:hypothetical protein
MRSVFAAVAFVLFAHTPITAQDVPPPTTLKAWAESALPRCPDGVLTLEPVEAIGPARFSAFVVTLRSTDAFCGSQKYLLYSRATQQVVMGSVIPLPDDNRPVAARVNAHAGEILKQKLTTTIASAVLPDGLKAVTMSRTTPYGPFKYNGYVDASERFLIIGMRGSLTVNPATTLRQALDFDKSAVHRGNPKAAVEIIEISEFQCPTCARAHQMIEPLIEGNLPRIDYARIELPLFEHHEWAVTASLAALAIQRVAPLRYWDFVDETFNSQEAIGAAPFDRYFEGFAVKYGLDWAALRKVHTSLSERQALLDRVSRLFEIGIASTPTFIINGQIMGFGPEGSFTMAAINEAIAAAQR